MFLRRDTSFTLSAGSSLLLVMLLMLSCCASAHATGPKYCISGDHILCDEKPVIMRGVNAMHIFGGDDPWLSTWAGIKIVREFVGDLKNAPLSPGQTYRDQSHKWTLHALQDLVDSNRKRGMVTIMCPMGWDSSKATEFTGCSPCTSDWYADYKARMREWAAQFKGQKDVWIEVMNEPFHPAHPNYSGVQTANAQDDALWLSAMIDMVDNLRSAGFDGIVVVPGSCWGQDETVIERMGAKLLKGRQDILFDVHIYNQWLDHPETIAERCAQVKNSRLPFIFAEIGPGSGENNVRDARPFIKAAQDNDFSLLAWGWGTWGKRKPINLQLNDGSPNDVGNYSWGSTFKKFLAGSPILSHSEVTGATKSEQAAVADIQGSEITDQKWGVTIEAESASSLKNCSSSDHEPYPFCGTGTLRFQSDSGFAQWSVDVTAPGHYLAVLKYCNADGGDQLATLSVNRQQDRKVKFTMTPMHTQIKYPDWYESAAKRTWRFVSVPVELTAGRNIISLATEEHAQGLSLDNLSFTPITRPAPVQPIFDAQTFGAKGDGKTLNTQVLQKAIDACAGTGGTVLIRNGRFLTGQLYLKSKMTLWIDETAELLGSMDLSDYKTDNGKEKGLVVTQGASDVFITGGGVIDGQGYSNTWVGKPEKDRPFLLYMTRSRNIHLSNLILRNSAVWTIVLKECERVDINALNIDSMSHPNRDGIDPCDSHDVTITNCGILSDDDSLCPKSYSATGVKNLFVKNVSVASGANGVKFGTDSYGCFDSCKFEDVTITQVGGAGISFGIADGATVWDVAFRNIQMGSVFVPINVLQGAGLRTDWPHDSRVPKKLDQAGYVGNILFENLKASARKNFPSCISGVQTGGETFRVANVTLRRVSIDSSGGYKWGTPGDPKEYAGQYPDYGWMGFTQLPAHGLYVRHAKNVTIEDCHFTTREPDTRQPVVLSDVIK